MKKFLKIFLLSLLSLCVLLIITAGIVWWIVFTPERITPIVRKQADKLIVLADSSKLGKRSNFIFSPLSGVDVLITDSNADAEIVRQFEAQGIEVIIVVAVPEESEEAV